MTKPRKVNTIKALKREINYYKKQLSPFNHCISFIEETTPLKHLKLQTMFLPFEVFTMKKDEISDLLIQRMTNIFADYISRLPIKTSYDEKFNVYRADLDLWVKEVKE